MKTMITFCVVLLAALVVAHGAHAAEVTIDAAALTTTSFAVQGITGWLDTSTVQSVTLEPGIYTFQDGAGPGFAFTVDGAGVFAYDAGFEGFLDGAGTPNLIVDGFLVTVDAQALTSPSFAILYLTAALSTASPLSFTGIPGAYYLYDQASNNFAFNIDDDGAVQYDPGFEDFLDGAGTATLVVDGLLVTVDAHALTSPTTYISSISQPASTASPLSLTGIPGVYYLYDQASNNFAFNIDDDGAVQYAPGFENFLDGGGTANLVVDGFLITVDAHALTSPMVSISNISAAASTASPLSLTGIPGVYYLYDLANNNFAFNLDNSGAVQYDPGFEDFLDGGGTANLVVDGFPITVDAHALTSPVFYLGSLTPAASSAVPLSVTGIPGVYTFFDAASNNFAFVVNNDGALQYDAGLEGFLDGAGTTTLVVEGFVVTMDAHALSSSVAYLGSITLAATSAGLLTLTVIPGVYSLYDAASNYFALVVDNGGAVHYDPGFEDFLDGEGTTQIVVRGFSIVVDARGLAATSPTFSLDPLPGILSAATVQRITVVPGAYAFYDNLSQSFTFQVDGNGGLQALPATFVGLAVSEQGTARLQIGSDLPSPPYKVKDINMTGNPTPSSNPRRLTDVNGTLFFVACEGVHGCELWKSDGSEAGTVMIKDIDPSGFNYPDYLTAVGTTLFFAAWEPAHGTELWKSDGTEAGTVLVKDINPGNAAHGLPRNLTNVNGTLFFTASVNASGEELWKSDGTESGTVLVKDIYSGIFGSDPAPLIDVNGVVFFTADDGTHGAELWKSNGTESGTVLVRDIRTGAGSSFPSRHVVVNGTLFFTAYSDAHGRELWKSDGTEAGTVLVKDIFPGSGSLDVDALTDLDGTLYFRAQDLANGVELWKSDGTEAGTVMVADINPGADSSYPASLVEAHGRLFFIATDADHGAELWTSDGTEAGTTLVGDIYPGTATSEPAFLTNVDGTLYFRASDGTHGYQLWRSDGTAAGTIAFADITPPDPTYAFWPPYIAASGSLVYLSADGHEQSPDTNQELWAFDPCPLRPWYRDLDGDGYGDAGVVTGPACVPPEGYVADGADCADTIAGIVPGAWDALCNGIDENCTGAADEGYASLPTSCGAGACASTGATSCTNGVVLDSCTPNTFPEVCDGTDNDCDGMIDNAPPPAGAPEVRVTKPAAGTSEVFWAAVPGASVYDVVRGLLGALRSTGGDYSVATNLCLEDDQADLTATDTEAVPAGGSWYLVRPVNCGGAGSYDSGATSQVGARDAEIELSADACP